MRLQTKTFVVYKFSELSDKAKDNAKQPWREDGYQWADEALESLEELAKHFDGRLVDWEIDWTGGMYSNVKFRMPFDMTKTEIRRRLRQLGTYNKRTGKGHGDCVLTGYTTDEDAIDGFRLAFREGETNLDRLMEAAFRSLLKATEADYESTLEDEYFSEMCEANGYEFYADGRLAARNSEEPGHQVPKKV